MPDPSQPVPSAVTIPLFGTGVGTKSPNVSAQMRTNMYVERYDDPDKTQLALFSRPGLRRFTQVQGTVLGIVGDVTLPPEFLGEWVLVATDTQGTASVPPLYLINGAGQGFAASAIAYDDGTPLTAWPGGPIRGASNGTQFVFTDGVNGWVVAATDSTFGTSQLATIIHPSAVAFPNGCNSITFCASRFVADDPSNPGRFRWSAAGDGTDWAALDFATAESCPDALSCVFEAGGQLVLFGTQTTEFWAPAAAGASGQMPFQRVGGANIQWGTTSVGTVKKCNDSVIFVGRNQGGNRQVVQLRGYAPQVISTPDVEADIENDPGADAATAMFFVSGGHPFYVLNLATHSWAFDMRTGTWDKWITDGSRFAGQYEQAAFGQILVTDYRDGRIYAVDPDVYTDDGSAMVREVVSKHASANLARLSLREVAIDCETGVGAVTGGAPPDKAVSVNGFSTYVNVPDNAAHQIGAPLTLEVMVTYHNAPVVASEIVRKIGSAATNRGWLLQSISGGIRGGYSNSAGAVTTTPVYPCSIDIPTRVSLVIAPTFMAIYINGEFHASVAVAGVNDPPSGEPLTIGCLSPYSGNANPSEFSNATISDVRLWNVARTAAQIRDAAFKRLDGTETGLVSYWKMNEGIGATVTDTKGVQNGTLTSTDTTNLPQWVDDPAWPNNAVARDPQIMLQWSKDGGHTYGNEVWNSLGTAGGYLTRAVWRNLGRSRDWVMKLRVTDAIKVVIIGAAALFGP